MGSIVSESRYVTGICRVKDVGCEGSKFYPPPSRRAFYRLRFFFLGGGKGLCKVLASSGESSDAGHPKT